MCWICGRISGFHGGTFAVSWRFWSFTSGIHTPLKSGGSAKARQTANISTSAAAQQTIRSFFATAFTLTNRSFPTGVVRSAQVRSHTWGCTEQFGAADILVTVIAKENSPGSCSTSPFREVIAEDET